MSAQTYAQPHGDLLFHWERPRRRKFAIAGFLLASLGLHALCFYLFQVIYPPTISLLPPPARVAVIAPTSEDARAFLNWLDAEDPALASQTLRPAEARALQLPKIAHVPSYIAQPPELKPPPPQPAERLQASALPPGIVPSRLPPMPSGSASAPSHVSFSESLGDKVATEPSLHFYTASRETPQSARFRVAVDRNGIVLYALLITSSGDGELDEQARAAFNLFRFDSAKLAISPNEKRVWANATIDFGTDITSSPPTAPAP